jgi:hypothetical protein
VAGGLLLISSGVFLSGSQLRAQQGQAAIAPGSFVKVGKVYINTGLITQVSLDPTTNPPMPAGTVHIVFEGQSYLFLYGEQADAFRQALDSMSTEIAASPARSPRATPKKPLVPKKSTLADPASDPG